MAAMPVYLQVAPEISSDTRAAMEHIDQMGQGIVPVGEERSAMQLLARNIPNQAAYRERMLEHAQTVSQTIGSVVPEAPIDNSLVWETIVTHDCVVLPKVGNDSPTLHLATRLAEHAAGHYVRSSSLALSRDATRVADEYYRDADTPFGLGIVLTDVQQVAHDIAVTADELSIREISNSSDQADSDAFVTHLTSRFSHPVYRGRGGDIVAGLAGEYADVDAIPSEPNGHYLTVGVRAIVGCVGHELSRPAPGDHNVMFTVEPSLRPMIDSKQIGMIATSLGRRGL